VQRPGILRVREATVAYGNDPAYDDLGMQFRFRGLRKIARVRDDDGDRAGIHYIFEERPKGLVAEEMPLPPRRGSAPVRQTSARFAEMRGSRVLGQRN
jgi:hypothetical protein